MATPLEKSVHLQSVEKNSTVYQSMLAGFKNMGYSEEIIYKAWRNSGNSTNQGKVYDEIKRLQSIEQQAHLAKSNLTGATNSGEESQIRKAIALSLQHQNQEQYEDPEDWIRSHDEPAGLKNLGQTCQVNVILQTLFNIPQLREYIIQTDFRSLMQNSNADEEKYQIGDILKELQVLFAAMMKGRKKFQDPNNLFGALQNYNQSLFQVGEQNDFLEVLNSLIDILEKGYSLMQQSQNQNDVSTDLTQSTISLHEFEDIKLLSKMSEDIILKESNIVNKLFQGTAIEIIEFSEEGVFKKKENKIDIGVFNLESKHGDLYKALQSYTRSEISDYKSDAGFTSNAKTALKISKTPEVLNFYVNRLSFDLEKFEAVKMNNKFHFEKSIYLDQFMGESHHDSELQQQILSFDNKIERLESVLKERAQVGDTNIKVASSIDLVIQFLNNQVQDSMDDSFLLCDDVMLGIDKAKGKIGILGSDSEFQNTLKTLNSYKQQLQESSVSIEEQLKKLKAERQQVLDKNQKLRYDLSSVLIHMGTALQGHYVCFSFDEKQQQWWKYNDRSTKPVSWQVVFDESQGSIEGQSNACCLFYKRYEEKKPPKSNCSISATLKQEVNNLDKILYNQIDFKKVKLFYETHATSQLVQKIQDTKAKFESQNSLFSKYEKFESFLLFSAGSQRLAHWTMLQSIINSIDTAPLKEVLTDCNNLDQGVKLYFHSLQKDFGVNSQVLCSTDAQKLHQLKDMHKMLSTILHKLGELLKIQNNYLQFQQFLIKLASLRNQFQHIGSQDQEQNRFAQHLQFAISSLLQFSLLKGCFFIDLLIQKNSALDGSNSGSQKYIVDLAKTMVDITICFYHADEIFVDQIKKNFLNSRASLSQAWQVQFAQQELRLTNYQNEIQTMAIRRFDLFPVFNKANLENPDTNYQETESLLLKEVLPSLMPWRSQLEVIQKEKKVVPTDKRLQIECPLYFDY